MRTTVAAAESGIAHESGFLLVSRVACAREAWADVPSGFALVRASSSDGLSPDGGSEIADTPHLRQTCGARAQSRCGLSRRGVVRPQFTWMHRAVRAGWQAPFLH